MEIGLHSLGQRGGDPLEPHGVVVAPAEQFLDALVGLDVVGQQVGIQRAGLVLLVAQDHVAEHRLGLLVGRLDRRRPVLEEGDGVDGPLGQGGLARRHDLLDELDGCIRS